MEYKCYYSDCLRSYNSKYNLKRHINSNHLNLKTYQCDQCIRNFASKKNLQIHLKTHTELKEIDLSKMFKVGKTKELCEIVEIGMIPLGKYYKDVKGGNLTDFLISKQALPSLAPIDVSRELYQKSARVPLLPSLLNYVSRDGINS